MAEIALAHALDAHVLEDLLQRWASARASRDLSMFVELERGFEAYRSKLFLENATLQAERPEDPAASARIESNQLAIKASTIALGELREALSRR
jgi:hypothetical protein